MKIFNIISSILLIGVGSVAFIISLSFTPTARLMPLIYSAGLVVFSLLLLILSLLDRVNTKISATENESWGKVLFVILVIAFYFVMINVLGFYIATFVFLLFFIMNTHDVNKLTAVLISVALPVLIYFFFDRLLHIAVPVGIIF